MIQKRKNAKNVNANNNTLLKILLKCYFDRLLLFNKFNLYYINIFSLGEL